MALVFGRLIGARDHECVGAGKTLQRFPQPAQWNQFASAKRMQRVDQHQIKVPFQLKMLEAIVQEQEAGMRGIEQLQSGRPAIRADANRNARCAHAELRFVAG